MPAGVTIPVGRDPQTEVGVYRRAGQWVERPTRLGGVAVPTKGLTMRLFRASQPGVKPAMFALAPWAGPVKGEAIRTHAARRARALTESGWCPRIEREETRTRTPAAEAQARHRQTFKQYVEQDYGIWAATKQARLEEDGALHGSAAGGRTRRAVPRGHHDRRDRART